MHDVIGNRRNTEDEKGAILKSRKDIDCRICRYLYSDRCSPKEIEEGFESLTYTQLQIYKSHCEL